MSEHNQSEQINSISQLNREDQLRLVAAVLAFYETDPSYPEVKRIRELAADPRFARYTRKLLTEINRALVVVGVLWPTPHRRTRDSAYLTPVEGSLLKELYLGLLATAAEARRKRPG